jgi:hypothetical protein
MQPYGYDDESKMKEKLMKRQRNQISFKANRKRNHRMMMEQHTF